MRYFLIASVSCRMLLKRRTGSGERGTEVWERVVSAIEIQYGR